MLQGLKKWGFHFFSKLFNQSGVKTNYPKKNERVKKMPLKKFFHVKKWRKLVGLKLLFYNDLSAENAVFELF